MHTGFDNISAVHLFSVPGYSGVLANSGDLLSTAILPDNETTDNGEFYILPSPFIRLKLWAMNISK